MISTETCQIVLVSVLTIGGAGIKVETVRMLKVAVAVMILGMTVNVLRVIPEERMHAAITPVQLIVNYLAATELDPEVPLSVLMIGVTATVLLDGPKKKSVAKEMTDVTMILVNSARIWAVRVLSPRMGVVVSILGMTATARADTKKRVASVSKTVRITTSTAAIIHGNFVGIGQAWAESPNQIAIVMTPSTIATAITDIR